jgi:hypothetical protein
MLLRGVCLNDTSTVTHVGVAPHCGWNKSMNKIASAFMTSSASEGTQYSAISFGVHASIKEQMEDQYPSSMPVCRKDMTGYVFALLNPCHKEISGLNQDAE